MLFFEFNGRVCVKRKEKPEQKRRVRYRFGGHGGDEFTVYMGDGRAARDDGDNGECVDRLHFGKGSRKELQIVTRILIDQVWKLRVVMHLADCTLRFGGTEKM